MKRRWNFLFLLVWFFVSVEKVEALESFSIMVLPDTQYYCSYPDREVIFVKQTEWIRDNAVAKKVKMVLHEGDLINSNNSSPEWVRAKNAMSKLGTIPYALSLGNHDYSGQKDTTFFNAAFPASNFIGKSWFGGVFENGKMDNAYYVFEAGGKNWLVLSLEYGPRQVVVDWAKGIVANNSDKLIILLTHGYMAPDGSRLGTGDAHNPHDSFTDTHDGDELWEELVKPSRNIVMVLSGHVVDAARRVDANNFGKNVYQILADYQSDTLGGNGYLRIMEFFPDQGKVNVKTFSPWLNQYKTEDKNQFELTVNWWVTPTQIPSPTPTMVPTLIPTQVPSQVPTVTPSLAPSQMPTQTPTQVPTQTPTQVSVLGDANRDGKVDLVDFSIWKSEYLGGMKIKCDFNKDGSVNLVDFGIWKREYLN